MNKSSIEQEIRSGKIVIALTYGDSMEPLLYNKSTRIVIQKVNSELNKNDLPVYKRESGEFVMHRIIKKDDDFYYTRGDNRVGLEKIPKEWVFGVVTEIHRKNKHFFVSDKKYKLYVNIWNFIYPIRYIFMKFRSKIKRIKNKKPC